MWKKSFVFCAFVTVALAAVAEGPLHDKPDKFKDQEGCYIPELDVMIPVSELAPLKGNCTGIRCEASALSYETCTKLETDDPSKVVKDISKSYPDCCPKVSD